MAKPAPKIRGVVETVLYVEDLERALGFYRDTLGFALMKSDPVRFCALNVRDRQVLLLFKRDSTTAPMPTEGGIIPPHNGHGPHHFGFAIAEDDYAPWRQHLIDRNVVIESEVSWKQGGRSLYFRDPDEHLVELITPGIWPNY